MNKKDILITAIVVLFVVALLGVNKFYEVDVAKPVNEAYRVYLNGKSIGLLEDADLLYNLINEEQEEIKTEYGVDYVYPPAGFYLAKVNTYSDRFTSVNDVYNAIAKEDDFSIKGYIITIKNKEDEKDNLTINVLDKTVFEDAIKQFILAFVSESDYNKYINNQFGVLTGIGQIIKNMYFEETITIKEGYISVNDKIYTDVDSLSQYLLFGENAKMDSYTVKLGDDIESISDEYKLNPQEFIIANPTYRDESVMLKIGDTVNVTLLNPVITFVYEVYKIEESVIPYAKQKVVDKTKPVGYLEISQSGITGLNLNHETFEVVNGEQSSQINLVDSEEIRAVVNEISIVGPTYSNITGTYIPTDGDWGWPTGQPSVITSKYSMRWGKLHEGIDISGTGYGSPIYAIADGVVVNVQKACDSCAQWANGNYVVIKHDNNYYSAYLHLSAYNVTVGQTVKKGDRIASMGQSGYAFGTHLHLGLYVGEPFVGGQTYSLDPLKTIFAS